MKKWTIGRSIVTGGSILIALLLLVGGIAYSSLTRLENFAGNRLRDDAVPGIVYSSEAVEYSLRQNIWTIMAGNAPDEVKRAKYLAQAEVCAAKIGTAITNYAAAMTQAEDRQNFQELSKRMAEYSRVSADYITIVKSGKATDAEAFLVEKFDPISAACRDQLSMMLKWNQDVAVNVSNEMTQVARQTTTFTLVISVLGLFIACGVGWGIVRSTNRKLTSVADSLKDGSGQVASSAWQVSSASQTLAEGSSEQAASLEETSASIEEMSSMIKRNSENALRTNELAKEARAAADKGVMDMRNMSSAMESIKISSDDIAKIIKTIDEIAFQTNILALNAAVEAARAGEAGMGFAVVADEVRNLAQRCAQAAKETADKIEGAIVKTNQGVDISTKVEATLNEIASKVRQVDALVTEVAQASSEQANGVNEINNAIGQMDKVTQNNAAMAEESAAAAEELSGQSEVMKQSVAELLQLVGRQNVAEAAKPISSAPLNRNKTPFVELLRHDTTQDANGSHQKKGRNNLARGAIPMAGDFSDF
jgi:methyl-accepting chemotaxis protein